SWKRFLHPPRRPLWTATRSDDGFTVTPAAQDPARYAFLGVRGCDLRAIAVQDRVLGARDEVFVVAVSCTEPADTCFCASVGAGPAVRDGYDLVLTELPEGYLAEVGSTRG